MNWLKLGHVFKVVPGNWYVNSSLTPSPLIIGDKVRVYAGFRDSEGISRIGYVDLDAKNPSNVLKVSDKPVIDIGEPGTFDDNGLILGDVNFDQNGNIRMYYVGFQLVKKVKFLAFSGVALSKDNGETFHRLYENPILDRSDDAKYIRAIHTALHENGMWKIWYAAGNGWEIINGQPFPQYEIYYAESRDGLTNFLNHTKCIGVEGEEYRIGRPKVYRTHNGYICLFTKGTISGDYTPGIAFSNDGIHWERKDKELNLEVSEFGWDSETLCYPSIFHTNNKTYAVYNGNKMGIEGFGLAELKSDDICFL